MNFLILRPLIIGITEYLLAINVLRKGTFIPKVIALFLLFLGTYQIGEFLYFAFGHNRIWLSLSLFSTTMLPPFGLKMIEKLSGKRTFAGVFFVLSTIFAATFFVVPNVVPQAQECNCFMKYDGSSLTGSYYDFYTIWGRFYVVSLTLSMIFLGYFIKKGYGDVKNMKLLFIGYLSFFPFSYIITEVTSGDFRLVASIMCSLAIFTAFIVNHIATHPKIAQDIKENSKHV
jgi:hypothetical protein